MGARSSKNNNPSATNIDGHLVEYFRNSLKTRDFGTIVGPSPTAPLGMTATGGVISDYTDPGPGSVYRAHVFTSSGVFDVTELSSSLPNNVDYLVVAGGGGGGCRGGGGGAGGLRATTDQTGGGGSLESTVPVAVASYAVTVGAGGGGSYAISVKGSNGVDSSLAYNGGTITSTGGGGAGSDTSQAGSPGGSGGGGSNGGAHGSGTANQGYDGSPASGDSNGGGGGAGATSNPGMTGAAGVQVAIAGPTATTFTGVGAKNPANNQYQYFAGGGGGGHGNNGTPGAGGLGGGGAGVTAIPSGPGVAATYATGSGGGGGGSEGAPTGYAGNQGGNGGSGIVVVRYQIGAVASQKASGGVVSYYDNKTIHTFTHSGTFTTPGSFNETVEYVAVGGGGGGGVQHGGGGGAGGYTTASIPLNAGGSPISAAIVIGAGAQGLNTQGSLTGTTGAPHNGNNTTIAFPSPVTAGAGGGGGSLGPTSPPYGGEGSTMPLGSGGGGGMNQPGVNYNNRGSGGPQGNPGGQGWQYGVVSPGAGIGGGGGGAGTPGIGNPAPQPTVGTGGDGVQVPSTFRDPSSAPSATTPTTFAPERGGGLGTPGPAGGYYVAGGGGGGAHNPWPYGVDSGNWGQYGGAGGGGHGGNSGGPTYFLGADAVENTGGGGGSSGPHTVKGGNGGSGIVLIAYPT